MSQQKDKANNSKHSFKTKSRFRLSFINENRFNEVWTIKFTRSEIVIAVLIMTAALSCLVATIILLSPIRTLLPGYLKADQRQENIANSMRIDSLVTRVNINNAYMSNLESLIAPDCDTISSGPGVPASEEPLPADSLLPASEKEKQFVRQFEEQERFNLTVLSPIAAEGISFYPPVSHATESSASSAESSVTLTSPPESTVNSIYSGSVIETNTAIGGTTTIMIQHPNGFVSRYDGVHSSFVTPGDKVEKGSVIGITSPRESNKNGNITFQLWNKGVALNPRDYIAF